MTGWRKARPDWDEYFLLIAEAVALRADCTRRKVGAVIVDQYHRIVATGYNGAYPGGPSCLAGQCPRGRMSHEEVALGSSYDSGPGSCVALHAEQNAVMYASMDQRVRGTIYSTEEPCDGCWRMLAGSGVQRVVWPVPKPPHATYMREMADGRVIAHANPRHRVPGGDREHRD